VQVDAALDENNQALVATLIKVQLISTTHELQVHQPERTMQQEKGAKTCFSQVWFKKTLR